MNKELGNGVKEYDIDSAQVGFVLLYLLRRFIAIQYI